MSAPAATARVCVVLLDPTGTAEPAGDDVVVRCAGGPGGVQLQRAVDAGWGEVVVVRTPGAALPRDVRARVARAFAGEPLDLGAPAGELAVAVPRGTLVDPDAVLAEAVRPTTALDLTAPEPGERFLVLVDRVPDPEPRWDQPSGELVRALAELWPEVPLVLASMEHAPERGAVPAWRARGVDVVADCPDWAEWFSAHRLTFSTVFSLGARVEQRFAPLVDRELPGAFRVLVAPSLEFRRVRSIEPAVELREEVRGLHGLTALLRERAVAAVERADLVLLPCEADRRLVEGLRPDAVAAVLPDVVCGAPPGPVGERCDLVVLAAPGHDALAAHEDAAVLAVREVLPAVRTARPGTTLRVLADRPSPLVQKLAQQPGVSLAPLGADPVAAVAAGRVCLAPYAHGDGLRQAAGLAAGGGLPLLCLPHGAEALDLGETAPAVVCPDPVALAFAAVAALADPGPGRAASAVRAARGGRASYRRALVHALAGIGVAPPRRPHLLPDGQSRVVGAPPAPPPPPVLPIPVEHRQALRHRPRPTTTADEQYAEWVQCHAPTPERLAELRAWAAGLAAPPLLSVLVPTYDSEPEVLADTLQSVVDQAYPHWELCIADDCSPDPRTREALREWAGRDPRIRLVLLEDNRGISGATNAALELATGEWVALLDHDDLLKPHALAEVARVLIDDPTLDLVYTDEDKMDEQGRLTEPFFKPAWSPEHLTSRNYVTHLSVLRTSLVRDLGGLRSGFDGSQDHDLVLRVADVTDRVAHIAEPLYTWRQVPGSTAAVVDAKPYAFASSKRALAESLDRRGYTGEALDGLLASTYRLRYDVVGRPKVTVLIPTRNGVDLMRRCVDSVRERSTWDSYELLVVDNQSDDPETLAYLASFGGRVLRYPHRFNYARMMNLAAHAADGDLLLFLNNDTEVIEPGWMEAMIEHAQRPEVGAVGCRLYYPDGRPQHEGVIVNYAAGAAGNVDHEGWWGFGEVVRDCSAVTGAVTMMRPSVFHEVGGFEERLRVAFNDVDLCLRVRQAGYRVVYTPYATLYHHESATRGFVPHPEDDGFFDDRWEPRRELFHDPYYNVNLDRASQFAISGRRRP